MAFARPVWGINHVLSYGQSYAHGWEGAPALTRVPHPGTLMLGESVRPFSEFAPEWRPVGAPVFQPLTATVQQHFGGPVLPPDAPGLLGETILETALCHWQARMQQDGVADPSRRLLASACGVGGRPIEALSRGADPALFDRLRDCTRAARDAAHLDGASYGITAILLLQGEHNNFAMGGTSEIAAYVALLRQLHADIVEQLAQRIAGQQAAPALFTYQTGGLQASETNSIAQAQLLGALTLPGCFMVGPAYFVTTNSDHPDANGHRWLGAQFGKVLHCVLTRGAAWRPLHPVAAMRGGVAVRLHFHVPCPPLAWGTPYIRQRANEVPDRGFQLLDAGGEVPIAAVELSGPDEVCITASRPLSGPVRVRYANAARGGCGNLRDSDPAVSDACYEYTSGAGHRQSAEIPELIGRPYQLHNWCVAFTQPVP